MGDCIEESDQRLVLDATGDTVHLGGGSKTLNPTLKQQRIAKSPRQETS
jgi:hypothetical protein